MSDIVVDGNGRFLWYKYASSKVLLPLVCMAAWVYLIAAGHLTTLEDKIYIGAGLLLFGGILPAADVVKAFAKKGE